MSGPGPEGEITRMARTLDGARTRTVLLARNSRGRHYSVPPAILLAAATYWPRQHSFPARSANRCISPPIPICHCPRGPSLFSVRATGVPRIPVQISPIFVVNPLFRCFRPTTFSSTFFSPLPILSYPPPPPLEIQQVESGQSFDRPSSLPFLTKCSNFGICPKIRLKVFSVRVIEKNQEGRNQITRRKCFFEFFSRKGRGKSERDFQESSLDKLLSLLRRVIFQDRKNRNREDEGIFGGEETWAYRGRNSNDPSNAPADVQTRIVRGIRRPVSQKVSQLYIKTIKREATAGFPPRPRLAQASCPDFMPVDRKFRSLETDPT